MADRTTTFNITSTDVRSNGTSDTEITTNVTTVDIQSDKDNIFIEVNLDNLGEHRQPDNTRIIYQPDTSNAADAAVYNVDRVSLDTSQITDIETFQVEPSKYEQLQPVEFFEVNLDRVSSELPSVSDFVNQIFNKGAFDSSTSSDSDSKFIEINKLEVINTPERVEQVFYKSIFDAISVTDDFNGVLPDDDQTAVIQDRNFDTSGVEDFSYRHIYKGLIDAVNLAETFRAEDGTIKDDSTIVDIFIASLFKTTDNDSAGTTDNAVFHPTSGRLDTATTNDILSTVITFLRSPVDTASAADSGRLNSQDYFSEEYVWEDYAGTNSYF
jgi:hypothetical protein